MGGANTGPPAIVGPLAGGASSVSAMASGPIRVYLNSANAARGSRSSAWNCASIGAASSASAQALQGLERAVEGAAEPRIDGLRPGEPRERFGRRARQPGLPGEIGRVGVAGCGGRDLAQELGGLRFPPGVQTQQAQDVLRARADHRVAGDGGERTLGLGGIGVGLAIHAGQRQVQRHPGIGGMAGGEGRKGRDGAGEVVLAHLRDATVDLRRQTPRRAGRGRRRGPPARRGEHRQQRGAGE